MDRGDVNDRYYLDRSVVKFARLQSKTFGEGDSANVNGPTLPLSANFANS